MAYGTSIIGIIGITDNIAGFDPNNRVFIGFGPIYNLKKRTFFKLQITGQSAIISWIKAQKQRKFILNPSLTICITRDRVYCRMKNGYTNTDVWSRVSQFDAPRGADNKWPTQCRSE